MISDTIAAGQRLVESFDSKIDLSSDCPLLVCAATMTMLSRYGTGRAGPRPRPSLTLRCIPPNTFLEKCNTVLPCSGNLDVSGWPGREQRLATRRVRAAMLPTLEFQFEWCGSLREQPE